MNVLSYWNHVRAKVGPYRTQLRFCLRVTIAGLSAFAIARIVNIPLHGLWAVLTAVVVSQMSVGGSLRVTFEYLIGTLGGAIYAGAIGVLIPHATPIALSGVLALTIAPLALAAAINPSFRVAPFSAVLVLLISGQLGEGPIESALYRFFEVALGGAVAVAVSLLVLPERAHGLGLEAAANILEQMARVLPRLLAGFTQDLGASEIGHMQDEIGGAVVKFQEIAEEAVRERMVNFGGVFDQGPLSRTLLRLRHDLVIIGRAAATPLPDILAQRLGPLLTRLGANASDFLLGSATALRLWRHPPPLDAVGAALEAYTAEIASLRSEGLTRPLSSGEVEHLFALSFALDQLHKNFSDLDRCVGECARSGRS